MKIYTKTGDDGNTGLQGDFRISKSHSRIMAYGTVDETNAAIGVVLTNTLDDDVKQLLSQIQNDLSVFQNELKEKYGDVKVNLQTGKLESNIVE